MSAATSGWLLYGGIPLVGLIAPFVFPAYTFPIPVLWVMILFAQTADALGGNVGGTGPDVEAGRKNDQAGLFFSDRISRNLAVGIRAVELQLFVHGQKHPVGPVLGQRAGITFHFGSPNGESHGFSAHFLGLPVAFRQGL